MKPKRYATYLLTALLACAGWSPAWSQSPDTTRKQYQEMRKNYAQAMKVFGQIESQLQAKAHRQAVVSLEELVKLQAKLAQAELPAAVKRQMPKWDTKIRGYAAQLERAGVKLPDSLTASLKKPAAPTRKPASSRKPKTVRKPEHPVKVTCANSSLVSGQKLVVLQYLDKPIPKACEATLQSAKATFDKSGSCSLNLAAGSYSFHLLYSRGDGTIVALSSGKQAVGQATTISLESSPARKLRFLRKGAVLPLTHVMARIECTMLLEAWKPSGRAAAGTTGPAKTSGGPTFILSPKHSIPVRLWSQVGSTAAVVWARVSGDNPTVEITSGWHTECRFQELIGQPPVRKATATFFLPEARRGLKGGYEALYKGENPADLLKLPINDKTRLITNRRFVEMWYEYEAKTGERVPFCRQPYRLKESKHIFRWGGDLKPVAHARVMMTWNRGNRAVAWGAHLVNQAGHVVNTPETAVGLPGDTHHPAKAEFKWTQRLLRRDGKSITLGVSGGKGRHNPPQRTDGEFANEEYVTEEGFPELFKRLGKGAIKGVNADVSDMFRVAVAYELGGKKISTKVDCEPWASYQSTHVDFCAPRGLNGVAIAMMDRLERSWAYGSVSPAGGRKAKPLERITVRWTGCRWQGYSTPGTHSHIQIGMSTFRRRQSIYGSDWGPAHELLHSWGYGHGAAHNMQINRIRRHYRDHHIYLADHPESEPAPITVKKAM